MAVDLLGLLSPESNIRPHIGRAQQRIALLRAKNLNDEANVFEQGLLDKIQNKDVENIPKDLESIAEFYESNIKREGTKVEEPKINAQNAATEIERALSIGDERGLTLSASDVRFAADAIAKGDTKKAVDYASKLSSRIESLIKQQDEETKTLVNTPEGEQFSIGDKTGTRYMSGLPVSRGNENTGMFNSFLVGQEVKGKMVPSQVIGGEQQPPELVAELETIKPAPEVYGKKMEPAKMTSMQEKEQAYKRAMELYNSGDDTGAVILMNAAGGKGMLGPFATEDLPMVFGERKAQPQPATPQPTQAPTGNERPSLDSIMNPKKTR